MRGDLRAYGGGSVALIVLELNEAWNRSERGGPRTWLTFLIPLKKTPFIVENDSQAYGIATGAKVRLLHRFILNLFAATN
jgi:hypothetical protein